ncbi:hypothetical protein LTS18_012996, partial [Coniosporium uncinatum]
MPQVEPLQYARNTIQKLRENLSQVATDPATPLDVDLIDTCNLIPVESLQQLPQEALQLVGDLLNTFPKLQQQPGRATDL